MRATNRIVRAYLNAHGIGDEDIEEVYTPCGHDDSQTIANESGDFADGGPNAAASGEMDELGDDLIQEHLTV